MTGMIFDIQKFSIHDGPGIRTTVFFKGCPLSCRWCHNPESQSPRPQLSFLPDRCIGCGYCFRACPQQAHIAVGDDHRIDRDRCIVCGTCTEQCYAEALEMIGRQVTVDEVLDDVLKDKPFYDTSGGGMTLSGGEPLMQLDFCAELLRRAKDENLHCCLETCGFAPFADLQRLLPFVDLFLYDIKETDSDRHRDFTGVPNERILDNLRRLHDLEANLVIRAPIVPGCNDTPEHFRALAQLDASLPHAQGVEIMPYHRLGESKIERIGLNNATRIVADPPDDAAVNRWIDTLAELGARVLNERRST